MIAKLLISSSSDERIKEVGKMLSQAGLTNPHPDLLYLDSTQKLGIAESRKIKEHFSFKPYQARGKAVVLEDASQLTHEAQNALLKTLEELPKDALFILGADSEAKLLPTVISRCQIIRLQAVEEGEGEKDYSQDIERLLRVPIEQRFEYIEKLKDREEFLHAMTSFFHEKLVPTSTHARSDLARLKEFLQELLQVEEWAQHNVNIRAILEYLMLVMPSKS